MTCQTKKTSWQVQFFELKFETDQNGLRKRQNGNFNQTHGNFKIKSKRK